MPWWMYSLIATLVNAWYPISQKVALNTGINRTKLLTYIFIGLFIFYLFFNLLINPINLFEQIKSPTYLLWGLLAGLFSFVGNVTQLKAVDKSPNPGYVQAVVVTNAFVVLVLSSLILHSPFTIPKAMATLVIVAGLYLLLVEKRVKSHGWQIPSILAAIFYGLMVLVIKQMSNLGISPAQELLVLFFFGLIGFLALSKKEKVDLRPVGISKLAVWATVIAIIIAFVTNLLNFTAIKLVPNPGYSNAVFNSSVVLTLFFSALIFPKGSGGEFNKKKWFSVLLILLGVLTIILSK